jgi:hypothetical protein
MRLRSVLAALPGLVRAGAEQRPERPSHRLAVRGRDRPRRRGAGDGIRLMPRAHRPLGRRCRGRAIEGSGQPPTVTRYTPGPSTAAGRVQALTAPSSHSDASDLCDASRPGDAASVASVAWVAVPGDGDDPVGRSASFPLRGAPGAEPGAIKKGTNGGLVRPPFRWRRPIDGSGPPAAT